MSDGVLSTSGNGLSAQILSQQLEVATAKKAKDIEEQKGEDMLKLIESTPNAQKSKGIDPSSNIGQFVNVKA